MAGAAGGFVTRALEAMLKECAANRGEFAALLQSIQSYLDGIKGTLKEAEDAPAAAGITEALSSAGRVLEGPQAELVLQPLRLAFETKHVKLVEPALDCLHAPNDEGADKTEEESPMMETVRSKCVTQLLLLGAIDSIQKKYWSRLKATQQIAIMDILLSLIEFASSYNSPLNLRTRMRITPERPPLNLLRQELAGTMIYLEILHKSTLEHDAKESTEEENGLNEQEKLNNLAEGKLASFCGQILKEASDLQPSTGETASADVHRVLDLRAPVIVMVLKGMCIMDAQIFRRHLKEFYPLITKLICCDQMEVRGALRGLFSKQLTPLMA